MLEITQRAHHDVLKLLDELHVIADRAHLPRIDEISDSIECLSRAYITPSARVAEYGAGHMTMLEQRLFDFLKSRMGDICNKDSVYNAVYFDKSPDDLPEIKILDIFLCRIRKKIAKTDYKIETIWHRGWRMTENMPVGD